MHRFVLHIYHDDFQILQMFGCNHVLQCLVVSWFKYDASFPVLQCFHVYFYVLQYYMWIVMSFHYKKTSPM